MSASRSLIASRYVLVALSCLSASFYLVWRIQVMNLALPWWSCFVLVAEAIGFLWSLTFLLTTAHVSARRSSPPDPNLAVDVFVTTYNEPVDIVRRTVMAACGISYPHTTWLLDDGNRREMRALAAEVGCRYLARTTNEHAKAGNLNHALSTSRGGFIALFDADHVADPQFLDRTLGYFNDPKVGFVQTPQEFFNFESHQHLVPERTVSNEHSLFYHVVQRGRDRWNSAMLCGCAAVVRRSAIDAIGGFATGTVTEDMHTSVRLHAAGWDSVFHPEILSAGIAPLDAASFRFQRLRWAQGAMQVSHQERLLQMPGLTLAQRCFYLYHMLHHLEGWRHAFFFLLPAFILFTGLSPLQTTPSTYLLHFAPYFLASLLAYNEIGRGHGRLFESEVFNLARCPTSMIATFAWFRRNLRFRVTPKTKAHRKDPIGSGSPWFILIVNLIAIATTAWRLCAGRSNFPEGSLFIVLGWAAFSGATASRLLFLSMRCARNRRATTRFRCRLAAELWPVGRGESASRVDIEAASADGFTLRRSPDQPPIPPGPYQGLIDFAGTTFRFRIELHQTATGTACGGPVRWPDFATRARFDLALHHFAIRRLADADRGDRAGFLTPLLSVLTAKPRRASLVLRGMIIALISVLTLIPARAAASGDDFLLLTGTDQSSTSSYTYLGSIVSLSGTLSKDGEFVRLWGDRLTYSYTTGGQRIGASSWGYSLSGGYQHIDGSNLLSGQVGYDVRNTALSPSVISSVAGTRRGARFELDADQKIVGNLSLNAIGSLATATSEYWTRGQFLFRLGGGLRLGPEVTWQGNPDYHGNRIGFSLSGIALGTSLHAGINGGYQRFNGLSAAYGALALSAGL